MENTEGLPEVEIITIGDTISMDMRNGFRNYGGVVDTDEHYIYFQIPGRLFIDKLLRKDLRYSFGRTWTEIPKRIRDENEKMEMNEQEHSPLEKHINQLHRNNNLINSIHNALTEWIKTNDKLTDDDVKAILSHFGNWISKEQFTYWATKEIAIRVHGEIR